MFRLRSAPRAGGMGLKTAVASAAPESISEAAELLCDMQPGQDRVRIIGGGSHQGIGYRTPAHLELSTAGLNEIVDWAPEDLTVVVEGGVRIWELEQLLGSKGQTSLLAESPGEGTVGGAVATATSGWQRLRYGPTRDRVLEVTLVSSDGRVVTAGGRVVKNVTGYDIPRLATGSLGAMGLIARVCLKLWPRRQATATIPISSPEEALRVAYRPLAVLETRHGANLYLGGTQEEITGQAKALGADPITGLSWPDQPAGTTRFSVRTPASDLRSIVSRLRGDWEYVAQFGVGEVTVGGDLVSAEELADLRVRAESLGGALVVLEAPESLRRELDPWGTPPASLDIQRRVVELFDPGRRINHGILPGGI